MLCKSILLLGLLHKSIILIEYQLLTQLIILIKYYLLTKFLYT